MKPFYDVDGITIYHADCADVLPLVPPDTVGLLLTDPPYGMDYVSIDGATGGFDHAMPSSGMTGRKVVGDDEAFDPEPWLSYPRVLLFGANHFVDSLPLGGWFVWDKTGGGKFRSFLSDGELAWHNMGKGVHIYHHLWKGPFRDSENGKQRVHPTQKPVALMRWIIEKWTEPGDLVFDPYMGSGPIARACADLGRRYIGVEIVEEYCQAAVDRLRQMTLGLEA